MAFYSCKKRTQPYQFYLEPTISFENNVFKINRDFSITKEETKNALVDIVSKHKNCMLPFSGGADSIFVLFCIKELLEENRLKENDITVFSVLVYNNGKILNPFTLESRETVKHLGIDYKTINWTIDDTLGKLFYKYFLFDCISDIGTQLETMFFYEVPGTMIVPEGRPFFDMNPNFKHEPYNPEKVIIDYGSIYERANQDKVICLFSYTEKLFKSFCTEKQVTADYPEISFKDWKDLPHEERYLIKHQVQASPKHEIYNACFPNMPKHEKIKTPGFGWGLHHIPEFSMTYKVYNVIYNKLIDDFDERVNPFLRSPFRRFSYTKSPFVLEY